MYTHIFCNSHSLSHSLLYFFFFIVPEPQYNYIVTCTTTVHILFPPSNCLFKYPVKRLFPKYSSIFYKNSSSSCPIIRKYCISCTSIWNNLSIYIYRQDDRNFTNYLQNHSLNEKKFQCLQCSYHDYNIYSIKILKEKLKLN